MGPDNDKAQPKKQSPVTNVARNAGAQVASRAASQLIRKGATMATALIPGVGTAISAALNALEIKKALKSLLDFQTWLRRAKFFGGLGTAVLVGLATAIPLMATIMVFMVLIGAVFIAFIMFVINSGAYIVPPAPDIANALTSLPLSGTSTVVSNPYIEVVKTAAPSGPFQNGDPGLSNITYSISVRARQGALTSIRFNNTCSVIKDGTAPNCFAPTPPAPETISPGTPFTFSYNQNYSDAGFRDTMITDTFTVTATAEGRGNQTAAGTAAVVIGTPPAQCPQGWPVPPPIYITQFPNVCSGSVAAGNLLCSHVGYQAIDISKTAGTPVIATHTGVATVCECGPNGCGSGYGRHIRITSVCGNRQFQSVYAHLQSIQIGPGGVVAGQTIGTVDDTGSSNGNHLHYEFRRVGGCSDQAGTPNNWPIMMAPPYIPQR
jgi:hypothetical protein